MFHESVSSRCQRRDHREDPSSGHGRRAVQSVLVHLIRDYFWVLIQLNHAGANGILATSQVPHRAGLLHQKPSAIFSYVKAYRKKASGRSWVSVSPAGI
jgi:hypothetical protein